MLIVLPYCMAQTTPFKGVFWNKKENIFLHIDLYKESITIPTLEFLDKTNGYMDGNIYGIWMVTSSQIKGNTATVKLANDFGSEVQIIELTKENDSTLVYKAKEPAVIKRAIKRKLVKIPTSLQFIRK